MMAPDRNKTGKIGGRSSAGKKPTQKSAEPLTSVEANRLMPRLPNLPLDCKPAPVSPRSPEQFAAQHQHPTVTALVQNIQQAKALAEADPELTFAQGQEVNPLVDKVNAILELSAKWLAQNGNTDHQRAKPNPQDNPCGVIRFSPSCSTKLGLAAEQARHLGGSFLDYDPWALVSDGRDTQAFYREEENRCCISHLEFLHQAPGSSFAHETVHIYVSGLRKNGQDCPLHGHFTSSSLFPLRNVPYGDFVRFDEILAHTQEMRYLAEELRASTSAEEKAGILSEIAAQARNGFSACLVLRRGFINRSASITAEIFRGMQEGIVSLRRDYLDQHNRLIIETPIPDSVPFLERFKRVKMALAAFKEDLPNGESLLHLAVRDRENGGKTTCLLPGKFYAGQFERALADAKRAASVEELSRSGHFQRLIELTTERTKALQDVLLRYESAFHSISSYSRLSPAALSHPLNTEKFMKKLNELLARPSLST